VSSKASSFKGVPLTTITSYLLKYSSLISSSDAISDIFPFCTSSILPLLLVAMEITILFLPIAIYPGFSSFQYTSTQHDINIYSTIKKQESIETKQILRILNTKTNRFIRFSFLFSFKDLNINKFQLKLSNFEKFLS
jgi:hypothetical protein